MSCCSCSWSLSAAPSRLSAGAAVRRPTQPGPGRWARGVGRQACREDHQPRRHLCCRRHHGDLLAFRCPGVRRMFFSVSGWQPMRHHDWPGVAGPDPYPSRDLHHRHCGYCFRQVLRSADPGPDSRACRTFPGVGGLLRRGQCVRLRAGPRHRGNVNRFGFGGDRCVMLGETDCGGSWRRCGVIVSFRFPVQVAIRPRKLPSSPSRLSRGYNRGPRGADAACADAHEPVAARRGMCARSLDTMLCKISGGTLAYVPRTPMMAGTLDEVI
jgi:hypothetical protein